MTNDMTTNRIDPPVDVELEAFCEWLFIHGHTPFSMSQAQLKEVWVRGLAAWHLKQLEKPTEPEVFTLHVNAARQAQEMASTLEGAKQ